MTSDLQTQATQIVMRRLAPFLALLYAVAYLDRVNVSFAALQMNRDLGLGAAAYGFGAGVFFLSYALFEVPSNLVLARVGARRWIARIMVSWGLVCIAMMFVRGPAGFYVLRFLLGAAEAGFFPGIIYYLSTWVPREVIGRAVSRMYIGNVVASGFGGVLAAGLLSLDGLLNLKGWQWLFLVEGLPAIVLGAVVLWWLPDRPADARWLTPEQRSALGARLELDRAQRAHTEELPLLKVLFHRTVWTLGISWLFATFASYGLQFWLPQIIKSATGAGDQLTALLTAAVFVPAIPVMLILGRKQDESSGRVLHAVIPAFVAAGSLVAAAWMHAATGVLVFLAISVVMTWGRQVPFWTLPPLPLQGRASAAGIAAVNTIGQFGGFIGPAVVGLATSASGGFTGPLLILAAATFVTGLVLLPLRSHPAFVSVRVGEPAMTSARAKLAS